MGEGAREIVLDKVLRCVWCRNGGGRIYKITGFAFGNLVLKLGSFVPMARIGRSVLRLEALRLKDNRVASYIYADFYSEMLRRVCNLICI